MQAYLTIQNQPQRGII